VSPFPRLAFVALIGAVVACERHEAPVTPPGPDILISIGAGTVAAPDSVGAGWARLRVEEDGAGHILVIFRLAKAATDSDLKALLVALDTAVATPGTALALGGPEIGDTGEVVVELTPGSYLFGCVSRGAQGHRHVTMGEAKLLVVTEAPMNASHRAPPAATQDVGMADFAYLTAERWAAGPHMLRVENRGRQEHQLRLVRLRPGSTLTDWMNAEDPDKVSTGVAGVARTGPGGVVYLPVDLSPGRYVAYCLISDPATRRAHVEMGMLREILVE